MLLDYLLAEEEKQYKEERDKDRNEQKKMGLLNAFPTKKNYQMLYSNKYEEEELEEYSVDEIVEAVPENKEEEMDILSLLSNIQEVNSSDEELYGG